jgi:WD40 repeat protein
VWDFKGKELKTLDPPSDRESMISTAKLSPTDSLVITVDQDHKARLWDENGNLLSELYIPLQIADFQPDGKGLVTVSPGGVLQFWQIWTYPHLTLDLVIGFRSWSSEFQALKLSKPTPSKQFAGSARGLRPR